MAPFFNPQLPEMLSIDRTDPFFVIRFLQSVYTNYLNHVKLNNSGIVTGILVWKCCRIQVTSRRHPSHDG